MLKHCRNNCLDTLENPLERVLIPLCGGVIFERGYSKYVTGLESATVNNLGIGSPHTWYGESDMRIRGCNVIFTDEYLTDDEGELPDSESDDENVPSSQLASHTDSHLPQETLTIRLPQETPHILRVKSSLT